MDIDVAAVRTIIRNLKGYLDDIDEQAKAVDIIRDNISCYWESESSKEYLSCMEETYNKLFLQKKSLNNVIRQLEDFIDEVVETENRLENIFSGGSGRGGGGGGGSHGGR